MSVHTCPWWLGFGLASPLRRLSYNPKAVLQPYVRPGMTVLEPGPGMGFFTLELARLVGPGGRVIVVDIQRQMLQVLRRRAERRGLASRIEPRLADASEMPIDDLKGNVDFVLAFAMVHELSDAAGFFQALRRVLRPEGTVLMSEPRWHVREADFLRSVRVAQEAGFQVRAEPRIGRSRSVLLVQV